MPDNKVYPAPQDSAEPEASKDLSPTEPVRNESPAEPSKDAISPGTSNANEVPSSSENPAPVTEQPKPERRASILKQPSGQSPNTETPVKKKVSFSGKELEQNKPPSPALNNNPNPNYNNNNNNNPPPPPITKAPTSRSNVTLAPIDPLQQLQMFENVSTLIFRYSVEPNSAMKNDDAMKFDILDADGNRLLIAAETSTCCCICCCKTDRTFTFLMLDSEGKTVFQVKRPCTCCCCCGVELCGDMCGQSMRIEMPDGVIVGEVSQLCRCCKPTYVIKNGNKNRVFRISGPCWGFCCCCRVCCDAEFSLLTFDPLPRAGKCMKVGRVSRNWYSLTAPVFSEGFQFGVSFPVDVDVRLKATLVGATILINFLHFEKDPCGPTQFCC